MQEKLAKVFREPFQIKRTSKQISDLKQLKDKGSHDIRMSFIKSQCLYFKVQFLSGAFKNSKANSKLKTEVKIVVRNNYPASPPNVYFQNQTMIQQKLMPFRDYLPLILQASGLYPSQKAQPGVGWSAKLTLIQIIKSIPTFLQKIQNQELQNPFLMQLPIIFNEYFEIDILFCWKFCQVHPIKLIKGSNIHSGFMVINTFHKQIVFLTECNLQSSYRTCDIVKGDQIVSLRKKKNNPNSLLLQIKFKAVGSNKSEQLKGKFGIQFISQDYDILLLGIIEISRNQKKQNDKAKEQVDFFNIDQSSTESDSDEQETKNQGVEETKIEEVLESIIVYQSMVDSQMTSENISQLVLLLKKAIEYYSALSDDRFKIYLDKLQNILSNEMAQVLLESADSEAKKKRKHNKTEFISVIDLI